MRQEMVLEPNWLKCSGKMILVNITFFFHFFSAYIEFPTAEN